MNYNDWKDKTADFNSPSNIASLHEENISNRCNSSIMVLGFRSNVRKESV